jgi:alpha-L-fucosidase 2
MVYGRIDQETIQLNEATLWAGGPNNNLNPEAASVIPEIRRLIFKGDYLAAQKLANEKAGPKGNSGMPYQSAGALKIDYFHADEAVSNYSRQLDLKEAVATTSFLMGRTFYEERVFTSFPDQVIVVHLSSQGPDKINCRLSLNSPLRHRIEIQDGMLVLNGVSGDHEGQKGQVRYTTLVKPVLSGGQFRTGDSSLYISDADSVTLYLSIATSFVNYKNADGDNVTQARSYLDKALKKNYAAALADHVAMYRKYFERVSFALDTTEAIHQPTDVRVDRFKQGGDPALAALYFQFGRYLLISCSQPGGQPATLQGLWNNSIDPPWDSKYTVNINTEMNYWPAEKTNLPEMVEPLIQMVKELSVTGRQSARARYGARGWVLHHNTDIWRITGVVDGGYYMWPEGGSWFCENLWEHYLYGGDKKFLAALYPIMKGASEFFVDELQVEPTHHWLVVSPTMSPEHSYRQEQGVNIAITAGATMDNQLVFDLFSHTIAAAKILGQDKAFIDTLRRMRDSLPPMQIGQYGQLQEWLQDWDNPEDHHRHVSHLYGLYPSDQISAFRTPELFEAAKTSLIYRGDVSTGWSMAWKINLWARLLDGNHALKLLKDQLSLTTSSGGEHGGTYPNLFDAHPPFQIDGNFGCTSGIAEMLLQSQDGFLFVLPALPDAWKNGEVKGLAGRGGFLLDFAWQEGKIRQISIHSRSGGNCRIRSYQPLKGQDGLVLRKAKGANPNLLFQVPDIKKPLISAKATDKKEPLKTTYVYDFSTEAGKTYVLQPAE